MQPLVESMKAWIYLRTHPIWIMTTTIADGTIIHISSNTSGILWSMPMLGFTNAGNIIVQNCSINGSLILTGPVITVGV
ncbi:unnamed protein product [Rotaria sp. Silwood2]|nr:unnamed protein product [Rotaria sp. Silwood2]CAF3980402.1 unnamed protein product [Rotaria sp. Silwood2]